MSKITFRLGTDNSDFKKGLADAKNDADKASGTIAGAFQKFQNLAGGIAAFAALKAGIGAAMSEASRLADLSDNLGASTDSLQAFDYVARQNGATIEQLTKALEQVSQKSQDLIDGNEQATAAFAKLGFSAKDFIGLGADEKFAKLAESFAHAEDRGKALSAITDILGAKVGPKLVATLDEIGGRGLPGLIAGAREAGQVIDKDVIASLDKFDDRLSRLGKTGKVFAASVLDHLITFGRVLARGTDAVAEEEAADQINRRNREAAQKDAGRIGEEQRAKAAKDAAQKKATEKRYAEDTKKLDEYLKAKRGNDAEAAKQALDSLTPEQRKTALARERLGLEKELAALPRNQIDSETKREAIRARILKITEDERRTNKEITDELQKQKDKLADINAKVAEAAKNVAKAQADLTNAQFDPFRFSLSEAASGSRGSARSQGNARLVQSKENQARAILDRNNLEFDESGSLRYVPAPGESAASSRDKQRIADKETRPRLDALMGGAAALRRGTANLDRKEQDPTKAQKTALKEALDESKTLAAMKKSLEGKYKNQ